MADCRGRTWGRWSALHSNTAVRVLVDAIRRFPLDVRMHRASVPCLTKPGTMHDEEPEEAETIMPIESTSTSETPVYAVKIVVLCICV